MSKIRRWFHLNGKVFACACCMGILVGEIHKAGRDRTWYEILDALEETGSASLVLERGKKKPSVKINMFAE